MTTATLSGVREHVAGTAAGLDAGTTDTRTTLGWLGSRGLIGAPGTADEPLSALVALVREVSAGSLAAGFSLWSQAMVLEYLRCCPTPVGAALAPQLASGSVPGATALAPAVADLAGRQPLPVGAVADGAGWRLRGTIPWASNLFDDAVVVTPARTPDGGRLVVLFRLSAAELHPSPPLLAMNGTGTGAVELRDVPVGADDVLSADLPGFMGRCVPAMLLLQTGLAVGLTDAALPAAAEHLSGPDAGFRAEHEALSGRHSAVAARLGDLAARPAVSRRPELARLRLDALHLAADVVRLEGVVAGGTGFRAESPTSRRRREVAFLPVQAPTEGQLRAMAATG